MSIQIKLKNSVVQDSTPSASDLPAVGEIALNANINSIGGFMRASDNSIVKIFGPGSLSTPTATTTVSGISELATNTETTTGTATNRVVTPAGLNAVTVAERTTSNTNYVAKAGSTMTGVLTMPNGSNSAPAINFGDSDSGIFGGTNTVSLAAGGGTKLTANATGIGIGAAASALFHVTATNPELRIQGTNGNGATHKIFTGGLNSESLQITGNSNLLFNADVQQFRSSNEATEYARFDSSGRLLVGQSASVNVGSTTAGFLQIASSTGTINSSFAAYGNNSSPCMIAIGRSRSGTVGSAGTALQDNDVIGLIRFAGDDGTDLQSQAASIAVEVDGTPGSNDMPGRLVFSTTADGASSPTERLRIDSAGLVKLPDGGALTFGADGDLEIKHNNDNSFINDKGTGQLLVQASGLRLRNYPEGHTQVNCQDDVVELYYDNTKRFETTSAGVSITGDITATGSATIGTDLIHAGDTDTKLSFGDNEITLNTAGTERLELDINETTFNDGGNDTDFRIRTPAQTHMFFVNAGTNQISIKTPNPQSGAELTVQGRTHTDTQFTIGSNSTLDGGVQATIYKPATNTLAFATAGANERMRIDNSGNVGIGTTSPAKLLDVKGGDGATVEQYLRNNTINLLSKISTTTEAQFGTETSHPLVFLTANNARIRVDTSGNVGIGVSSVQERLHVANAGNCNITSQCTASGSGANAAVQVKSADGGDYLIQTGNAVSGGLRVYDGGASAERVRISSSGRVGIGTTSPDTMLTVAVSSGDAFIRTTGGTNQGLLINKSDGTLIGGIVSGGAGGATVNDITIRTETGNKITFAHGTTERMRMDAAGRLLVGTTSTTLGNSGVFGEFCIRGGTEGAAIHLADNDANVHGGMFTSDHTLAMIIRVITNHPMIFRTNNTERMRITNTGLIGVGTGTNTDALIDIQGNASNNVHLRLRSYQGGAVLQFWNGQGISNSTDTGRLGIGLNDNALIFTSASASSINAFAIGNSDAKPFYISTGNTRRITVLGDGRVGINNTSPAEALEVSYPKADVGIVVSTTDSFSSGNSTLMQFREVNTVGGSIAFTNGGTTTAYVTSSDYRLKENVVTLTDAITRLKTLKPYRFNFIKTPDTTVDGFLAHEVTAVPEAVTGEKDAMRKIKYTEEDELPEGKNVGDFKEYSTTEIDPQGVDYAKFTPLLTAALQEAIAKIETLETKVAALEAA